VRDSRKAVIFLADNRIPVYEGDIIKLFVSENNETRFRWYPRSCDYRTPDKTRLGGKQNYLRLKPGEYASLEYTKRLALMSRPDKETHIYRITPEKRKPLLRLPPRGLPFRQA
jgi:hypothetical protein